MDFWKTESGVACVPNLTIVLAMILEFFFEVCPLVLAPGEILLESAKLPSFPDNLLDIELRKSPLTVE